MSLLFRTLGVSLHVATSTKEVVDNLFRDEPPLRDHYMDAKQDLFAMLKSTTKSLPQGMERRLRATLRARRLGCVGCE